MIDWVKLFDRYHVDFRPAGRNELRTFCPWCNDGAEHMAINTTGKGWHCWKDHRHRGVNPVRLVAAMLKLSTGQAAVICGVREYDLPETADLNSHVLKLLYPQPRLVEPEPAMPANFQLFHGSFMERPFRWYLRSRGFSTSCQQLSRCYGLRYALHGPWRYRIIFPVVSHHKLRAWTGRSIVVGEELRYLTSSERDGAAPIGNYLLFYDLLGGGDRIVLCEGPFDAMKLWELGQPATCFFTARPSRPQIEQLYEVLPRYHRRVLLLDRNTVATGIEVQAELTWLGVSIAYLPDGIKDPGELRDLSFLA